VKKNKKMLLTYVVGLLCAAPMFAAQQSDGIAVNDFSSYESPLSDSDNRVVITKTDMALAAARGCAKLAVGTVMGIAAFAVMMENGYESDQFKTYGLSCGWATWLIAGSIYDELRYIKRGIFDGLDDTNHDDVPYSKIQRVLAAARSIISGIACFYVGKGFLNERESPDFATSSGQAGLLGVSAYVMYLLANDAYKNGKRVYSGAVSVEEAKSRRVY